MAGGERQLLGLAGDGLTAFAELQTNQVLLAKCLDLQFWDLEDYPHASKHVRLAAHDARTIHGDTVVLFQHFLVTARHIVNSLMPMLLDGIRLKDQSLIAGAFNEVLLCVTEMSSGADDVHSRYGKLVSKIDECFKEIDAAEDARKFENEDQIKRLKKELIEYESERQPRVVSKDDEKKKHKGETAVDNQQTKALLDPALERCEVDNRPEDSAMAENQAERNSQAGGSHEGETAADKQQTKALLDSALERYEVDNRPDDSAMAENQAERNSQAGGSHEHGEAAESSNYITAREGEQCGNWTEGWAYAIMGVLLANYVVEMMKSAYRSLTRSYVIEMVISAVSLIGSYVRHLSSGERQQEDTLQGERQQEDTLQEEINKPDEQTRRIRSEEEASNKRKKLKEAEKPINAEGLRKAKNALEAVMFHLSEICQFWTTLIQNIEPLADEQGASDVYRSGTGSDNARKTFLEKMSLSQKGWERLDALCMDYVRHFQQDPVEGLDRIFAFLSAPIGQPREEIEAWTSELRKVVTPTGTGVELDNGPKSETKIPSCVKN